MSVLDDSLSDVGFASVNVVIDGESAQVQDKSDLVELLKTKNGKDENNDEQAETECASTFTGQITLTVQDLSLGGLKSEFTFNLEIERSQEYLKLCKEEQEEQEEVKEDSATEKSSTSIDVS